MTRNRPYHLLIADDDDAFRDILRDIFEPWFSLLEAESGEQAVEIVECERVDLVLLDMNMHELSGIDTIRIVKRIDSQLPCILVTGEASQELEVEARRADAWGVLPKPIRKDELLQSVSTAIDSTYGDPDVFSFESGSLN